MNVTDLSSTGNNVAINSLSLRVPTRSVAIFLLSYGHEIASIAALPRNDIPPPVPPETVSQCRMVIARRLSGVVAISCIRLLRRLLRSLHSLAMTLRHSLPSKGGHEKSNSPEGDNLLCPPPAEVSRSDGGGRCNLPLYPLDKER